MHSIETIFIICSISSGDNLLNSAMWEGSFYGSVNKITRKYRQYFVGILLTPSIQTVRLFKSSGACVNGSTPATGSLSTLGRDMPMSRRSRSAPPGSALQRASSNNPS